MLGVNPVTVYDVWSTVTDCIGLLRSIQYTDTVYLSTDRLITASYCTTNDTSVMLCGGNLILTGAVKDSNMH